MRRDRTQYVHRSWSVGFVPVMVVHVWLGAIVGSGVAQHFTFREVVGSNTPIPGASTVFDGGFYFPALDNGRLAFYGSGGNVEGIYTDAPGVLTRVADTTTVLPGNPGEPIFELEPAIDAGRVVFQVFGDVDGVYLYQDGVISVVADTNTPVPGATGNFEGFGFIERPAMHDGQVVFIGDGPDVRSGVYRYVNGSLSTIADSDTSVPNQTRTFEPLDFTNVAVHQGAVAFVGNESDEPGLYLAEAGMLRTVVDVTTSRPGDPGDHFIGISSIFGGVDMDETSIGFLGSTQTTAGVYRYDRLTGEIRIIADTQTLVPGTDGEVFDDFFSTVSVSDGHVAIDYGDVLGDIIAPSSPVPHFGIYTDLGGQLQKVVAAGDVIDGRTVDLAWMGSHGFDDRQIAFWVKFTDTSQGIYVATLVPEPNSTVLVATPLLIVLSRVFRKGVRPC